VVFAFVLNSHSMHWEVAKNCRSLISL